MSFCHQVTWYTCTSTSILPCKELKPFLEFYEVPKTTILYSLNDDPSYWNNQLSQILQAQFNKGQTGSYPEAVTLATEDARQVEKIEDYDRMIRIILLTTISCTHLDIVHSSQYV